jgi:hypothetical protein
VATCKAELVCRSWDPYCSWTVTCGKEAGHDGEHEATSDSAETNEDGSQDVGNYPIAVGYFRWHARECFEGRPRRADGARLFYCREAGYQTTPCEHLAVAVA